MHAVLSGLSGREALRGMLARLQPKEEVLLLGWGVPMPLPVRSRRYDDQFLAGVVWGGREEERGAEFEGVGILTRNSIIGILYPKDKGSLNGVAL